MERYLSAYFQDEENLLRAAKDLKENQISILEVFTPFPVHGLDQVLNYKRSRIPTIGFIAGAIGAILAFGFQTWAFVYDYPLFVGGKPNFAIPSFIPITFEITVLFAAFGMVFAFLIKSNLGPGSNNKIYDERITDDRFLILIDYSEETETKIKEILEKEEAQDVRVKENKM